MLQYHAAYYKMDNGWYMASVLDFPGVCTQGRSLDHARRMLRSALREMTEWLMEDGKPIPLPNPRARDRKAEVSEPIRLFARTATGAAT